MQESANASLSPFGMRDSAIWSAVARIKHSSFMIGCPKLAELLTFIVNATVGGQANDLKETIIGVSVFGRRPDYNPKVDTIVRSQAWRLRKKLEQYYESEGLDDPLIIDLPRGHYIPVFRARGKAR